jgi:ribosomal protein RSM22 (predicted rRNA methylase)
VKDFPFDYRDWLAGTLSFSGGQSFEAYEQELVRELQILHKHLISTERGDPHFSSYSASEKKVSAYTLFYGSSNFVKLPFLLDELYKNNELPWNVSSKENQKEALNIVDYGAGPGSLLWSYEWWCEQKGILSRAKEHHYFIDQSPQMLAQAKKIGECFFSEKKEERKRSFLTPQEFLKALPEKIDVLMIGHAVIEMGEVAFLKLLRDLAPRFLVIIEPGTSPSFQALMKWKEKAENYSVLYPCKKGAQSCPLQKESENWCHQIVLPHWSGEWLRLGQLVRIDRRTLPMLGHVYERSTERNTVSLEQHDANQEKAEGRIVRYLGPNKFCYEFEVCVDPEAESLEVWEFLFKDMKECSKAELKQFALTSPGQSLSVQKVKLLDKHKNRWRVVRS